MALIKCYECGKEISDKAAFCPHCGAPKIVPEEELIEEKEGEHEEYQQYVAPREDVPFLNASDEKPLKVIKIIFAVIGVSLELFWIFLKVVFFVIFVIPLAIITPFAEISFLKDIFNPRTNNRRGFF